MSDSSFDPAEVVNGSQTISDKIRQLHARGYSRRQIADLIGRSYQQVRQVLVEDERRAARRPAPAAPDRARPPGLAEADTAFIGGLYRLEVEADGVLRLPPALRQALDARAGSILVGQLEDDRLVILSSRAAARRAQSLVLSLNLDPDRRLSEELIEDRRREAATDA